eukprot:CAMPEP_0118928390 /NCGR_PEP_ID=MMETSP1169-20130426/5649_1 /TAXON_ID=36882 /ORGANISM="Pyramimonas obovata, Strain CCMP722" /LENGTH=203 /DNA_ID=CAMNT_0006870343 /DNA_START=350 /DNA_END=958 /DNA_ORIENTATION=-
MSASLKLLRIDVPDEDRYNYVDVPTHFDIVKDRISVGRATTSDIVLDSKSVPMSVSRTHLLVVKTKAKGTKHNQFTLEVCGRNEDHVKLNGERVEGSGPVVLSSGDVINLCEYVYEFQQRAPKRGRPKSEIAEKRNKPRQKVTRAIKEFKWKVGQEVEVLALEIGFRGGWFPAVVLSAGAKKMQVEYTQFIKDDQQGEPLREW